jgi:hypothetical protein
MQCNDIGSLSKDRSYEDNEMGMSGLIISKGVRLAEPSSTGLHGAPGCS